MAYQLNLDDLEGILAQCNARSGDLFDEDRMPQLHVLRALGFTGMETEGGSAALSSIEKVDSVSHLMKLNAVRYPFPIKY